MTLRTMSGRTSAESVDDVSTWLRDLSDCPPVHRTVVAACRMPAHRDEPGTWWYAEADARAGVARLRCLACAVARSVLDSDERWTYPPAWACSSCRQSIAEAVFGLHVEQGVVTWLALALRCVNCGDIGGVADFVVPGLPFDEVAATL